MGESSAPLDFESGLSSPRAACCSTSGIIKPCSCKKSRCLKKYCECFASNRYCDGCFCTNCQNLPNPPPIVEDPEPPIRNLPVNHAYHEEREPKLVTTPSFP